MEYQEDNKNYQIYLEERKLYIDIERESTNFLDKAILSISTGAFGISLIFMKQFNPIKPHTLTLLVFSWILLLISILSMLGSYFLNIKACRYGRTILDRYFEDIEKARTACNPYKCASQLAAVSSIILFVIGIILLALFCLKNII